MSRASPLIAFLDANTLYSALLRDILMRLAIAETYRPHWSDRVEEEWMRSLLGQRPDLTRAAVERVRTLMNAHLPHALVRGYEDREAGLILPDPDDRHVLAAAIHCGAAAIVTANLRDFPEETLALHGIRAVHPDTFICELIDADRDAVLSAFATLRGDYRNPPRTAAELLSIMEKQGLVHSAEVLKSLVHLL